MEQKYFWLLSNEDKGTGRENSMGARIRSFSGDPVGGKESSTKLDEWRKRVEIMWRQKSRELWLTIGDKNSKFFHATTITNRRKLFIPALKDGNGC